ncbi:MAG TPA: hypothetical protein VGQ33_05315, partial [Vicinamibacteria bacterium]|nr:hypothetical protein [Vicinamibacteria bacterium]
TPAGKVAAALSARARTLGTLNARLVALYTILQEADAAPTPAALETAGRLRRETTAAVAAAALPPS